METGKKRRLAAASLAVAAAFGAGAIAGRLSAPSPRPAQAGFHSARGNADLRLLLRAQQVRR
jgi:hypothetical protein